MDIELFKSTDNRLLVCIVKTLRFFASLREGCYPNALGIEAASFLRRKLETEAEAKARKDIAESPTALPERPKKTKVERQK